MQSVQEESEEFLRIMLGEAVESRRILADGPLNKANRSNEIYILNIYRIIRCLTKSCNQP